MKKVVAVVIAICISLTGFAQDIQNLINNTQFSPNIKWKQISTKNFTVIFPDQLLSDGQRMANTIEFLYWPLHKTLKNESKKYPIIIANQSTTSNGFVQWSPRMVFWYGTPPQSQFTGAGEWLNMLASHEGRHTAQFDKFNQGFTRLATIFYGQNGIFLPTIFIPDWFWEGDAVCTETALTGVGRGRMPGFDMPMRASILSNQNFSYYKAYLLSYKDYYPSLYVLGYHLTTFIKRQYGIDTLNLILDKATRNTYYPFTFNHALKKYTHKGLVKTYNETTTQLKEIWSKQLENLNLTSFAKINLKHKRGWTNYEYPQFESDTTILSIKDGLDDAQQIVRLYKSGREEKLTNVSLAETLRIPFKSNHLVWAEQIPDIRFAQRSFSDLCVMDLRSKNIRRLEHHTKLFAPDLSHDAKIIVAVEFDEARNCSLVLLDAQTGKEIKRFANPANDFITMPTFSDNDKLIVFTSQSFVGKSLIVLNVETGSQQILIPASPENITAPVMSGNYVFFNSPYSGIDNIYCINVTNKQQYQITCSKFGAFNPCISADKKAMLYSDYAVDGYNVAQIEIDSTKWTKIENVKINKTNYFAPLVAQEQSKNIMDESLIPKNNYPVNDYNTNVHALNVHSWWLTETSPVISFSINSNDVLNTTSFSAGVSYNTNEKNTATFLNVAYAKWFTIINLSGEITQRSVSINTPTTVGINNWVESQVSAGLSVPLDFSQGNFLTKITLSADIANINHLGLDQSPTMYDFGNGSLVPLTYSLLLSNVKNGSSKDIGPRFAQVFQLVYHSTPFASDYAAEMLSLVANVYFPGIGNHDNLKLGGYLERQSLTNYVFASYFAFPRGYDAYYYKASNEISVDYSFPIFYPDFAFGPFLYVKRVKGTLFGDYGLLKGYDYYDPEHKKYSSNYDKNLYRSAGAELKFDVIPLSLMPQALFTVGVRYSYLFDNFPGQNWQFFWSMNF